MISFKDFFLVLKEKVLSMFAIIEMIKKWLSPQPQKTVQKSQATKPPQKKISQKQKTQTVTGNQTKKPTSKHSEIREQFSQFTTEVFQKKLNSLKDGAILELWPPGGEYEGPIAIDRPLIIEGHGGTIWSRTGPVLSIESDRVSLHNLRIEVTGENSSNLKQQSAIFVKSGKNLLFRDVEVRGTVMGISEEEGEWKYPESLDLGQLAYGKEHDLLLRIVVPVSCQIVSNISGLELKPHSLKHGWHQIQLHLEKLPKDTLVNGNIFLVSASVKRRINITAHILFLEDEQVLANQNRIVWEPEDWSSIVSVQSPISTPSLPNSTKIRRGELPNNAIFRSEVSKKNQGQQQSSEISCSQQQQPPINPIFTSKPTINQSSEPSDERQKKKISPSNIPSDNLEIPKRKIIRNKGISSIFKDSNIEP